MKELFEITPKEWLEFKNEHQNYHSILDYAVVKDFGKTMLIDRKRINFILNGGQVYQNMVRY